MSSPLDPSFNVDQQPPDLYGPDTVEGVLSIPDPDQPAAIRSLTNTELANFYQSLVGFVPQALESMPPSPTDHGHDTVVQSQSVGDLHVVAYVAIANEVADAVVPSRVTEWAPTCTNLQSSTCAETFITQFAAAAFRRPAPSASIDDATVLYESAPTAEDGLKQVVRYILLSPYTNYLMEEGRPGAPKKISDYDLASRMSFALCRRPPSSELLEAAARGELADPVSRLEHAKKLWEQPCAKDGVASFFLRWLGANGARAAVRSPEAFPTFNQTLAQFMLDETATFLTHSIFTEDATLRSLFTADMTFMNDAVGELYGVEVPGDDFIPVELPPSRRGLLTHPSILTATARPTGTSPVNRGRFVLEKLLCATIPSPPNNVTPPEQQPGEALTPRELWARHVSDPNCSSCHKFLDPVGFAFEGFDEIGRERTEDRNGYPIDDQGGIPLLGIRMGELSGVAELAPLVAESPNLSACFARQWLRYALGRLEHPQDRDSLLAVAKTIHDGASLREGMLELFRTESFEQRTRGVTP